MTGPSSSAASEAPVDFDALHRRGLMEARRQNFAAAAELIAAAIQANPHSAAAHCNLGNVLRGLGRREDALASYDRALALDPRHAEAFNNRGAALHELKRDAEALESYDRALALNPDYAEALHNRGNVLRDMKRHEDALASYERALALKPDYPKALFACGNALHELGRDEDALACFERALASKPDYAEVHYNWGRVLETQSRVDEALVCYRKAVAMNPADPTFHQGLIFATMRASADYSEVLALCTRFAAQFEQHVTRLTHHNLPEPDRKLKVGYVSGDFWLHALAYYLEPVLASHDRREVEVFCYSNHDQVDDMTRKIMRSADHWRSIAMLPDDEAAALVQQDGIDILVDLSGHTAHNRLLMFARKPAPVQVTWVGLPCTTGLATMDYRFTSWHLDPVGMTEHWNTEKLVRLSTINFQPTADLPPIGELPSRLTGSVTFASFNHPNKITPAMCALWSRILHEVPNSRLLLHSTTHSRQVFERRFLARGIGAERLLFFNPLPLAEYLEGHNKVDIGLDPFPYNGGTTTKNALWMGVPTVSLAGPTTASRVGLALMTAVGLEAFVAKTEEDYVQIAVRWAGDADGLSGIRRTLRQRLRDAPATDAQARTRELEAAYRGVWRTWCGA